MGAAHPNRTWDSVGQKTAVPLWNSEQSRYTGLIKSGLAARMNWSGKAKILIVDDNPEKLLALQSLLSKLNEEVLTAKTGAEALRLLLREDLLSSCSMCICQA